MVALVRAFIGWAAAAAGPVVVDAVLVGVVVVVGIGVGVGVDAVDVDDADAVLVLVLVVVVVGRRTDTTARPATSSATPSWPSSVCRPPSSPRTRPPPSPPPARPPPARPPPPPGRRPAPGCSR